MRKRLMSKSSASSKIKQEPDSNWRNTGDQTGYLHGALEGVIVAGHIRHNLTFVRLLVVQKIYEGNGKALNQFYLFVCLYQNLNNKNLTVLKNFREEVQLSSN
jgi:hypothetical protein